MSPRRLKREKKLCVELEKIKDKNDPRYVLKSFCDKTTFHCTSHGRGDVKLFGQRVFGKNLLGKTNAGKKVIDDKILGEVIGVCDDPRLCENEILLKACQEQCLDLRSDKLGVKDKKSKNIRSKIDQCKVKKDALKKPIEKKPSSQKKEGEQFQEPEKDFLDEEQKEGSSDHNKAADEFAISPHEQTDMPDVNPVVDPTPPTGIPSDDIGDDNARESEAPFMGAVPPPPPPPPAPAPGKNVGGEDFSSRTKAQTSEDLLAEIRSGTKLRKSSERDANKGGEKKADNLMGNLAGELAKRRAAITDDSEDDDQGFAEETPFVPEVKNEARDVAPPPSSAPKVNSGEVPAPEMQRRSSGDLLAEIRSGTKLRNSGDKIAEKEKPQGSLMDSIAREMEKRGSFSDDEPEGGFQDDDEWDA